MSLRGSIFASLLLAATIPSAAGAQIEENRVPLQTALSELNLLRAEYADFYNKKNAAGLAAMYDADAFVVASNGSVLAGRDAIAKSFGDRAGTFSHVVITSDTLRVYGNTAIDQGTLRYHPAGSTEVVERYLIVLRRGMKDWKIVRLAVTPVAKQG